MLRSATTSHPLRISTTPTKLLCNHCGPARPSHHLQGSLRSPDGDAEGISQRQQVAVVADDDLCPGRERRGEIRIVPRVLVGQWRVPRSLAVDLRLPAGIGSVKVQGRPLRSPVARSAPPRRPPAAAPRGTCARKALAEFARAWHCPAASPPPAAFPDLLGLRLAPPKKSNGQKRDTIVSHIWPQGSGCRARPGRAPGGSGWFRFGGAAVPSRAARIRRPQARWRTATARLWSKARLHVFGLALRFTARLGRAQSLPPFLPFTAGGTRRASRESAPAARQGGCDDRSTGCSRPRE